MNFETLARIGALLVINFLFLNMENAKAFELVAHRGKIDSASSHASLENTLQAVKESWQIAVEGVELDVRVSRDGAVYLYHDNKINGKRLRDLNFAEINALAAGRQITLLAEVLQLQPGAGYYLLDLKESKPSDAKAYLQVIDQSSVALNRIILQSDKLDVLAEIKRRLPEAKVFYLNKLKRRLPFFKAPKPSDVQAKISDIKLDGISLKGRRFIDRKFIEAFKRKGLKVLIWTINDIDRISFYRSLGAHGVITDNSQRYLEGFTQ